MKIIRTVREIEDYVAHERYNGHSIGLVPTMGALHEGHMSLVERSVADNGVTVVSLFVNPTQFNNPRDLATYPRQEEDDFRLLARAGVDAVFAPTPEEMYPGWPEPEPAKTYDLGPVAEVMEGKFRPGHFQGVAQVVHRLFELTRPDRAYFGEKDFQQIAVINRMVETEGLKVQIIPCPIKRGDDGLALSSRNALLSEEGRRQAPEIHRILAESVDYAKGHSVRSTHDSVVEALDANPMLELEYYEIVDGRTLKPVVEWDESDWIVGCITVYCGDAADPEKRVRLIDNIAYRRP